MTRVRLFVAIGLIWLVGCWVTTKPAPNTSAEEWRCIVLQPGEDACVACVGQTVEFPFEYKVLPSEIVDALAVRINGKRVKKPELRSQSALAPNSAGVGDAFTSYVFRATEPGTYRIKVTPHYLEKSWGTPWECVVFVKGTDS